jgi:mannose-6-phosphate isomerase-like protein (cupin superfamily)
MSKDTSRHIHHVPANGGPCISYTGNSINLKLTAEESSGELTVMENLVPSGAGPPLHVHEKENEAYYVLEGEFEVVCGDETVRGGPGTFVHGPRGVPHRYRNIGPTTGRMLFAFTPAGIEEFFIELGSQKELNPPLMIEIAQKYGITIMPPKPAA